MEDEAIRPSSSADTGGGGGAIGLTSDEAGRGARGEGWGPLRGSQQRRAWVAEGRLCGIYVSSAAARALCVCGRGSSVALLRVGGFFFLFFFLWVLSASGCFECERRNH